MRSLLGRVRLVAALFGINFDQMSAASRGLPRFLSDWRKYQRLDPPSSFRIGISDLAPALCDYQQAAGTASGMYFLQDLWAARKIFAHRPPGHLDIGSRIDGFVAHLLTFMPVEVVDIRPLHSSVKGLRFIQDDATDLAHFADNTVLSLSSLNAAEHFGLGRYSDPVDPFGHEKFLRALQRVLAPGGRLYFSVPIGRECIKFNSHRIFHASTVLKLFSGLQLLSFSYLDDAGSLHEDVTPNDVPETTRFGCGFFEFTK